MVQKISSFWAQLNVVFFMDIIIVNLDGEK
jgi:hypothetical protein